MATNTIDLEDRTAFRAAWDAHESEMRRFAQRRLTDTGAAEDAVQEAFLRAWRRHETYDAARGTRRAWLFGILRNVIVDMIRARSSRPQTVDSPIDVIGSDDHDRRIAGMVVRDALQLLTQEHRSTIIESFYYERPAAEVARRHGVPLGTVRSRLFYGLKALGVALDTVGFER
jgi:RNA polymerase sigma-70 factor (ECF subfamily)